MFKNITEQNMRPKDSKFYQIIIKIGKFVTFVTSFCRQTSA